ncbi:hypothetical protein NEMBOFW57_003051 [Staphylotrichum longicolle]|uniref:Uncharacterized protein n=1 Tax=Staphylotrichum longicolle TaxID=669026 RepID=A0AAD4F477_9PEZI|nr:hypothetical protein NEMBOFW57_003051 [Staphylotrichum longicolle]
MTIIATIPGGTPTAKTPQTAFYRVSNTCSPFPHCSDPTDLHDDYLSKSKGAAARWSGSERKIAKARQQQLNASRRNKAALLGVFDIVGAVEEEETAEDEAFEYNEEEPGDEE